MRLSTESLRIAVYACTSSISSEVSITLSVAEASWPSDVVRLGPPMRNQSSTDERKPGLELIEMVRSAVTCRRRRGRHGLC